MIATTTLSLFAIAALLLLMSPGPNMAFVVAHGAAFGARGGAAAALGIATADLVLTALTASGVTALVAAWPPAFNLIRYAGAVYLLWMAYKAIRHRSTSNGATVLQASLRSVFARSLLNAMLNPKALLFFVVFLPQFVDPARGSVAWQLVELGCILTLMSTLFNTTLGAISGAVKRFFAGRQRGAVFQSYGLATILTVLAVRLLVMQRPA